MTQAAETAVSSRIVRLTMSLSVVRHICFFLRRGQGKQTTRWSGQSFSRSARGKTGICWIGTYCAGAEVDELSGGPLAIKPPRNSHVSATRLRGRWQ